RILGPIFASRNFKLALDNGMLSRSLGGGTGHDRFGTLLNGAVADNRFADFSIRGSSGVGKLGGSAVGKKEPDCDSGQGKTRFCHNVQEECPTFKRQLV